MTLYKKIIEILKDNKKLVKTEIRILYFILGYVIGFFSFIGWVMFFT